MATSVEMRASARKEEVQLTEREKWQLTIELGAISCGLILVLGIAVYLFGPVPTMDAIGILALGAVVYSFKTLWAPR